MAGKIADANANAATAGQPENNPVGEILHQPGRREQGLGFEIQDVNSLTDALVRDIAAIDPQAIRHAIGTMNVHGEALLDDGGIIRPQCAGEGRFRVSKMVPPRASVSSFIGNDDACCLLKVASVAI